MRQPNLLAALAALLIAAGCQTLSVSKPPDATPAAVRAELERIEDLRIVHRAALQDLHDARALAMYLKDWGGPDRDPDVETLFVAGDGLYGVLRGVDHGASGLQA